MLFGPPEFSLTGPKTLRHHNGPEVYGSSNISSKCEPQSYNSGRPVDRRTGQFSKRRHSVQCTIIPERESTNLVHLSKRLGTLPNARCQT